MPRPLSLDLRERIIAAYECGEGTQKSLSSRFRVGEASVRRLVRLKRETGGLSPRKSKVLSVPPKIDGAGLELLRGFLEQQPDLTNWELKERLGEAGIETSTSGVSRALKKLGWTRKKKL